MRYAYGITAALLLGGSTLTLATGYPAGAQVAQNDSQQMQSVVPRAGAPASFADLTQQLAPAVVNISTRQRVRVANTNPFAGTPFEDMFGGGAQQGPQTREAQSLGSGFIISADGYVVTNNHVITADGKGEVESITVTMPDGTEFPARLIGRDAASDLAVLKMIRPPGDLKPIPFGDGGKVRKGDWVISLANPFAAGFQDGSPSVSWGIVSNLRRRVAGPPDETTFRHTGRRDYLRGAWLRHRADQTSRYAEGLRQVGAARRVTALTAR